jgi:O-antigen ligase
VIQGRPGGVLWSSTLTGAWLIAAAALGGLFAYSAFLVHPLALPAALLAVGLTAVSLSRPEVGIAATLLLVSAAILGFAVGPHWLVGAVASGLLLLIALARLTFGQDRFPLPRLSFAVLAYAAVVALMVGSSQLTGLALPVVRTIATGLFLFVAIASTISCRRQVQWVLAGAVAGGALVALDAALQYWSGGHSDVGFFTTSGELVYRVTGGFGGPNELGGFLVVLAPFALCGALISSRGRLLYLIALVLIIVGVYVSFSRGAWIGLAVAPLFFLRLREALFAAPLLAAIVAFVAPGLLVERFATFSLQGPELATRIDIWRVAASVWRDHPFLGVGLGEFPTAYAEARVPGKLFLPATIFEPPPHAHNLFLQQLAEGGILGLLAVLAILGVAIHLALRLRRHPERWVSVFGRAALASLVAFAIHNLFDVTIIGNTGIYFLALLGLLSAVANIARRGWTDPAAAAVEPTPPPALASALRPRPDAPP